MKNKSQAPRNERSMVRKLLKEHDIASRELNYYTTAATGQTSTAAGVVFAITQGITQGDGVEQRKGMSINVKDLLVRLQAGGAAQTVLRAVLFTDRYNQGALPGVTEVLDTASTVAGYQITNRQSRRFKVLTDECIPMTTGGSNASIVRNYHHKFDQLKLGYNGTTDVATANGPNQLFLLIIDNLSANHATYSVGFEVRYFDS